MKFIWGWSEQVAFVSDIDVMKLMHFLLQK